MAVDPELEKFLINKMNNTDQQLNINAINMWIKQYNMTLYRILYDK